ncbi:MAG: fibro-slime domain-containing protein [Lachnospiraceae bacterium]|nr:fibro-slime domain-containing protein [Lachnospiraceae bacterium]
MYEKIMKNSAGNSTQRIFKYVVYSIGLIVLFVCLYLYIKPAYTSESQTYVYFDNALAGYDEVYYSINGTDYTKMLKLTENTDKYPASMTNVNVNNLFVTAEKISNNSVIYFKGYDSGIVFDTVSNYRVNNAAREWGYNYENFIWTSEAVTVTSDANCYYAPPLLMQNKYGGYAATVSGGNKSDVQYIYAHGEKEVIIATAGDAEAEGTQTVISIAKPEEDTSYIQPDKADNRTFYDAEYKMTGKLLSVNDVYNLGILSQSSDGTTYEGSVAIGDGNNGISSDTKVYTAIAEFYDYYSDWELAGNPLYTHKTSYTQAVEGSIDYRLNLGLHYTNNNYDESSYYYDMYGSFSEGASRISYTYQGLMWNYAISNYYADDENATPLYFGSNNWFTGNGRYDLSDRHGRPLFTEYEASLSDDNSEKYYVKTQLEDGTMIKADNWREGTDYYGAAYLIPVYRQYLASLETDFFDTPHGFSNSRAVEGLAAFSNETIMLNGTDKAMPYFNQSFIEGENEDYVSYGRVYNDVNFAFKYNEETGYYEYDSTKDEYATIVTQYTDSDGKTKYYMNYTGDGVTKADNSSSTNKQFYPFNSSATNGTFATENLMFGMKLKIPFNIYVDEQKRNNNIFKFSGDDDVWIYVDDQLVLDIGGTHTAVGGIVDLKNGYALTGSSYSDSTGAADSSFNVTQSGISTGITAIEKAAFSVVASNDEIGIDPDYEGQWIELSEADFFDDIYKPYTTGVIYTDKDGNEVTTDNIIYKYEIVNGSDGKASLLNISVKNVADSEGNPIDGTETDSGTEGYAVLRLKEVQIDEGSGGDLSEHNLTIYYMERGLNSSNFKLAFNFIEHTERTVEKEWADGAENHVDDSVQIDLYRTVPEVGDVESVLPDGYTVVRSVAYQYDEASSTYKTQENSSFANAGEPVKVMFKTEYDESATDNGKYVALTLSGVLLTGEYYEHLATSALNLNIYYEDKDADGNVTKVPVTASDFIADENGKEYIYIPNTYAQSNIYVEFNAVDSNIQFNCDCSSSTTLLSYKKSSGNAFTAWVLEANTFDYIESLEENAEVTSLVSSSLTAASTSQQKLMIPSIGNTTNGELLIGATGNLSERTIMANQLNIYFVHAERWWKESNNHNNHLSYEYQAVAIPAGDKLKYAVENLKNDRKILVQQGVWTGSFETADYTDVAEFINKTGSNMNYETLIDNTDVYGKNIDVHGMCVDSDDTSYDNETRYAQLNTPNLTAYTTGIVYSDAVFVDTVTLDYNNEWNHTWTNIIESLVIDGENYDYKYFIKESQVNDADGTTYITEYYDLNGNLIPATSIDYTEDGVTETLQLYSIDDTGYVQVANVPETAVNITKGWSTTVTDEQKKTVSIDVYNSLGEKVGTLDINSENNWYSEMTDLPLYTKTESGWSRIEYYISEQDIEGFIPKYNSSPYTLTLVDGSQISVYPATFDSVEYDASVTNRPDNSGLFVLQVVKVDSENTATKLQGAIFTLQKDNGDGTYTTVGTATTDSNGTLTIDENLEGGYTYVLTETVAPDGYHLDMTPIEFTVNTDVDKNLSLGTVEYTGSSTFVSADWIDSNDTVVITVKNELKYYQLPATGGIGQDTIIILGFIIVLASLSVIIVRKIRANSSV